MADSIIELVEKFARNSAEYKNPKYNETELRVEFVNPFWELLGWDVNNVSGKSLNYRDVIHEDEIRVGQTTKAPDYSFRIGGRRVFFLEAKKPSIDLKNDPEPAYQLRRYAYSGKLPISILTDFEEFSVYDTTIKPAISDKPHVGRMLYFNYQEYVDNWDFLRTTFSYDEIQHGNLERFIQSKQGKKPRAELDRDFLDDLDNWRILLARNIALRNPGLSERELNYAVQMTIDRLIFLRMSEDRGLETQYPLQALLNGEHVYPRLVEIYYRADERYNSGLFQFSEKDGPNPDSITPTLTIDDKLLKDIIRKLYYPDCPYEFSILPVEVLGNAYEQFLGKRITLTAGHHARIEEKPEVRKAGGVYYTPQYIVDYIVKNTVGKLLENKTPAEVSQLHILDPACGSGSFLLGAYQYLMNWHLEFYRNEYERTGTIPLIQFKKEKNRRKSTAQAIFQGRGGDWFLSTAEKKRILLNNIYGVDIDANAVEVTKLSLLLKVLENENSETLARQLGLWHERALPNLANNIKCGNSLIGPDYYEQQQTNLFDEQEALRINAFDWEKEFPGIFAKGGFDVVIGNPPYGALFSDIDKAYIKNHFQTYKYRFDSYVYFIEKAIELTKNNGYISFITPEPWLRLENNDLLREFIANNADLEKLLICGENVFTDATVNTIVFRLHRGIKSENVEVERDQSSWKMPSKLWKETKGFIIDYKINPELAGIFEKIREFPFLSSFGEAIQGITPYDKYRGQSPELIKRRGYHFDQKHNDTCGKWLSGKNISRYSLSWSNEWLSYGNWLAAPRDPHFFEGIRLLFREIPGTGKRIQATIPPEEVLYHGHSITPFKLYANTDIDILYLLGIVNSKLISWYGGKSLPNFGKEVFPKLNPQDILAIPIRPIKLSDPTDKALHDRMVSLVETMLALHKRLPEVKTPQEKEIIQRQIDATDAQIDKLVYKLYGLTKEEIRVVEVENV